MMKAHSANTPEDIRRIEPSTRILGRANLAFSDASLTIVSLPHFRGKIYRNAARSGPLA